MALPIIIDTDPGQDDAIALLLAMASDELDILGIVTVAGNVPLALTTRNARIICELAGRQDIPVFAGCETPLKGPLVTAEEVHGSTGLDGPDWPEPSMPIQAKHGVDWMIDTLRAADDNSVTLCPLGPLTNIAAALLKAPDVKAKIKRVVLMGGAYFEQGNITPSAEFNIYVDPHAANVVFESGLTLVMHTLDVTHKALMPPSWIEQLRSLGTRVGIASAEMLSFYQRFDKEKYGSNGGPLHDPCVIAYLLKPELFKGRDCNVCIETESELTRGATVIDWWQVTDRPANCLVIGDLDAEGFFELIRARVSRLS